MTVKAVRLPRPWLAAALFSGIFLGLGAAFVGLIGLGHDEVIHALVAARWADPRLAPNLSDWLPWMVSSYMGAPKSYLLYLAFKVFGIGVESVRWTTLLIGALALFPLLLLAARCYDERLAFLLGALVATDPAFLLAACYDTGPAVLSIALKLCGLWLLGEWRANRSEAPALFAAGLSFGLGLWDKAHFLWFLAAFGICASCAAWAGPKRPSPGSVGTFLAGFFLAAAPWLAFNLRNPLITFTHPGHRGWGLATHLEGLSWWTLQRWRVLLQTFSGDYMCGFATGVPIERHGPLFSLSIWIQAAVGVLSSLLLLRRGGAGALRGVGFWLGLSALTFAFACMSPLPVKGHHLYMLYPFPQLAFIAALDQTEKFFPALRDRSHLWLAPLFLALLACHAAALVESHRELARSGGSPVFYRGLAELAARLESEMRQVPGGRLYAQPRLVGPMVIHSGGRLDPRAFPSGLEAVSLSARTGFLQSPGTLLATRLPPFLFPDDQADDVLAAIRKSGNRVRTVAVLPYCEGRPWAAVYRVSGSPLRTSEQAKETLQDWLEKGSRHYLRGDMEAAERNFDAALRLEPGSASARMSLGVVLLGRGRAKEALENLDKAVEAASHGAGSDPSLAADAFSVRASAWMAMNRPDRARQDLERALRAAPVYWPRRLSTLQALRRLGDVPPLN